MNYVKRAVAVLPNAIQLELRRLWCAWLIARSRFGANEPETDVLVDYIRPGDWVVDVGANIGQYTWQFSRLVGPTGRVIAVEPVSETFSLLAANVQRFRASNVSLMNVALSDQVDAVTMYVPESDTGLKNFYLASIGGSGNAGVSYEVLALPLDSIEIRHPIALIKIDAEGHDDRVLAGMMRTIRRFKPVLIVESPTDSTRKELKELGYQVRMLKDSPNTIFYQEGTPGERTTSSGPVDGLR